MAFDMFYDSNQECIGHHEEFLFSLAEVHHSRYPQLLIVWNSFYDDPCLSPHQAGTIVHELIDLLTSNGGLQNKPLAATVIRLLPFFSIAKKNEQEIRCSSD
jgi:hypothetical protein